MCIIFRLFADLSFPTGIVTFCIATWIEDNFQFIFERVQVLFWIWFVCFRVFFYFLVFVFREGGHIAAFWVSG